MPSKKREKYYSRSEVTDMLLNFIAEQGISPAREHQNRRHAARMGILNNSKRGVYKSMDRENDRRRSRQDNVDKLTASYVRDNKSHFDARMSEYGGPSGYGKPIKEEGVFSNPRELELMDPPHPYFLSDDETSDALGQFVGDRRYFYPLQWADDSTKNILRKDRALAEERASQDKEYGRASDELMRVRRDKEAARARRLRRLKEEHRAEARGWRAGRAMHKSSDKDPRATRAGYRDFIRHQDNKADMQGMIERSISKGTNPASQIAEDVYKMLMKKLTE